jgi:uncharacterized protein YutE (UPF0331/DUF86 family)
LKYHTLEWLFQPIVDLMLDINHYLIKELNLKISEDLQGTFYILGGNHILPEEFDRKIAPIVGLRNRIIHRYEELNLPLFAKTFRRNLSDFEEYLAYINKYLNEKI